MKTFLKTLCLTLVFSSAVFADTMTGVVGYDRWNTYQMVLPASGTIETTLAWDETDTAAFIAVECTQNESRRETRNTRTYFSPGWGGFVKTAAELFSGETCWFYVKAAEATKTLTYRLHVNLTASGDVPSGTTTTTLQAMPTATDREVSAVLSSSLLPEDGSNFTIARPCDPECDAFTTSMDIGSDQMFTSFVDKNVSEPTVVELTLSWDNPNSEFYVLLLCVPWEIGPYGYGINLASSYVLGWGNKENRQVKLTGNVAPNSQCAVSGRNMGPNSSTARLTTQIRQQQDLGTGTTTSSFR